DKLRYSAFAGTCLDLKLRERGVRDVYLVGVCSDICVLHAAVDAYNLGYTLHVYEKGVASFYPEGHAFALQHCKNTLGAEIL
ncbi:MAG: cysteine hydrolase, partial [Spirochaetaceae bacterium]|nr:cysteine hydrolase [Spirochaetaceae bacterium]